MFPSEPFSRPYLPFIVTSLGLFFPLVLGYLAYPVGTKDQRMSSLFCLIEKLPRKEGRGVEVHLLTFPLLRQTIDPRRLCAPPKHKLQAQK